MKRSFFSPLVGEAFLIQLPHLRPDEEKAMLRKIVLNDLPENLKDALLNEQGIRIDFSTWQVLGLPVEDAEESFEFESFELKAFQEGVRVIETSSSFPESYPGEAADYNQQPHFATSYWIPFE